MLLELGSSGSVLCSLFQPSAECPSPSGELSHWHTRFSINFSFLSAICDPNEANSKASTCSKPLSAFFFCQTPNAAVSQLSTSLLSSSQPLAQPQSSYKTNGALWFSAVFRQRSPNASSIFPTMATLAVNVEEESTESCIVVANRRSPRSKTSDVQKVSPNPKQRSPVAVAVHTRSDSYLLVEVPSLFESSPDLLCF